MAVGISGPSLEIASHFCRVAEGEDTEPLICTQLSRAEAKCQPSLPVPELGLHRGPESLLCPVPHPRMKRAHVRFVRGPQCNCLKPPSHPHSCPGLGLHSKVNPAKTFPLRELGDAAGITFTGLFSELVSPTKAKRRHA